MAHTKGPWKIDPRCATRVRDDADTTIASAGLASRDRDDAEANARLIAAAPTLLALCKRIAADDGLNDLIQGIGEKPEWWDELHATIAKLEAK